MFTKHVKGLISNCVLIYEFHLVDFANNFYLTYFYRIMDRIVCIP